MRGVCETGLRRAVDCTWLELSSATVRRPAESPSRKAGPDGLGPVQPVAPIWWPSASKQVLGLGAHSLVALLFAWLIHGCGCSLETVGGHSDNQTVNTHLLLNDVLFKIVFGGNDSARILRAPLNALLRLKGTERIVDLTILSPFSAVA